MAQTQVIDLSLSADLLILWNHFFLNMDSYGLWCCFRNMWTYAIMLLASPECLPGRYVYISTVMSSTTTSVHCVELNKTYKPKLRLFVSLKWKTTLNWSGTYISWYVVFKLPSCKRSESEILKGKVWKMKFWLLLIHSRIISIWRFFLCCGKFGTFCSILGEPIRKVRKSAVNMVNTVKNV
jgi:hypothetical protein